MWFNILKAPILGPEHHYTQENNDGFVYLLDRPKDFLTRPNAKSQGNKIWESNDGNAKAKVRVMYHIKNDKRHPYWGILAFELKHKLIGKGLGEEYVREMREELQGEKDIPLVGGKSHQNWSINFWKRMKDLGLIDWDMV